MSKILYLSCHSILEYDEVRLFHELGHQVFSPGAYVEPANPGDASLRPSIPGLVYDPVHLEKFHAIGQVYPGQDQKDHLSQELVDEFDIVVVMHLPRWIENNWGVLKGKRVIWRTIGQSVASVEQSMQKYRNQGLEIVRYSPQEERIPHFAGQDGLIRFYKDPQDYGNWNGNTERVITFAQHMKQRDSACNYSLFEEATRPFPRHLFGPGNEGLDWTTGKVPYETLQEEMRNNRVYFYTGTYPASYTLNFMEAWMTGIPIVAIGPEKGNAAWWRDHDLYEIHHLIQHGVNGFVSDSIPELQSCIRGLLKNPVAAKDISEAGRKEAIRHFGKDMIMEAWRKYLEK